MNPIAKKFVSLSLLFALAGAAIGLLALPSARGCTRVLWNDNHLAVLVGRTMDWPESTMPILTVLPRGMRRWQPSRSRPSR